mgnify:CR=1 FL=1
MIFCGVFVALLASDSKTVFSRGYSGVASLSRDLSLSPSVVFVLLSLLPCAQVGALPVGAVLLLFGAARLPIAEELLPFGAAAAAEELPGTLGVATTEALAISSIGTRLSACTCALCAARTC